MSKRKPLPYHAGHAIDDAIIENGQALKALETIINGANSREELYRLIAKAVSHIGRSTDELKSIQRYGR